MWGSLIYKIPSIKTLESVSFEHWLVALLCEKSIRVWVKGGINPIELQVPLWERIPLICYFIDYDIVCSKNMIKFITGREQSDSFVIQTMTFYRAISVHPLIILYMTCLELQKIATLSRFESTRILNPCRRVVHSASLLVLHPIPQA